MEGLTVLMHDYIRDHLSIEKMKESAIMDCKLRRFFENPENITHDKNADFFKENIKMDILTVWSQRK
jgi:hypothetical protein